MNQSVIFHSRINIPCSILSCFFIRNLELGCPYRLDRSIGSHSTDIPYNLTTTCVGEFAQLLNLYYVTNMKEYRDSILFTAGETLAKNLIQNVPSFKLVDKTDIFWQLLQVIVEEGYSSPFVERQLTEILLCIINQYHDNDSIINARSGFLYNIVSDTHIKFPRIGENIEWSWFSDGSKMIPIEFWLRVA